MPTETARKHCSGVDLSSSALRLWETTLQEDIAAAADTDAATSWPDLLRHAQSRLLIV